MIVYIVEAWKNGSNENHSYTLGVWDDLDAAKKAADAHLEYRGGKYKCIVFQCELNSEINSDWSGSMLYQTY